jgi:acetyltransferase-like isoleucine patch superfamily enzyme
MWIYQYFRKLLFCLLSDAKRVINKGIVRQPVLFSGKGSIFIGNGVVFGVECSPGFYSGYSYLEARHATSSISIGCGVWLNNTVVIICNGSEITICDDVLIGWDVQIVDSDFHVHDPVLRKSASVNSFPVYISENVWIGSNVRILKGVTIGANSIIANGSIVTKSVPANVLAAGVPAIVVRSI